MKLAEQIETAHQSTKPVAIDRTLELAIEKALLRDPKDVEAFLVYADWLQQHQDPRGELIACQLTEASANQKLRATTLTREHAPYLLGIFGAWGDGFASPLEVEWRCGFIRRARLYVGRELEDEGWDQAMLTEALLALPSLRFVEELELGCGSIHEDKIPEAMEAVLRRGSLITLRKLAFTTDGEEEMLSWTDAGELGHLSKTAPHLGSLFVKAGRFRLSDPEFPELKELEIETCGMTKDNIDSIAGARWPALEKMNLWFGSRAYGVEIPLESLERALDQTRFPKLRHLGLCNNDFTDELVDLLAQHPLLAQLETLDLSKGTMSDEGARRMSEQADRFQHLTKIELSENFIGAEAGAVKEALDQVELGGGYGGQRHADDENHRYADVGE